MIFAIIITTTLLCRLRGAPSLIIYFLLDRILHSVDLSGDRPHPLFPRCFGPCFPSGHALQTCSVVSVLCCLLHAHRTGYCKLTIARSLPCPTNHHPIGHLGQRVASGVSSSFPVDTASTGQSAREHDSQDHNVHGWPAMSIFIGGYI